jgi:hypothetical protein
MLASHGRRERSVVSWPRRALPAALVAAAMLTWSGNGLARPPDIQKTAFVAALDPTGKPLTALTKVDWGVREDGVDRPIIDAVRATAPLQLVILIDTTKAVQPSLTDLRGALTAFVSTIRSGNPDAAIALIGFGGSSVPLADFGKSAADLDRAVQRLFPDDRISSALLEAIVDASKSLAKRPSPRRAIVAINQEGSPESGNLAPQTIADAIVGSEASFWSVSYRAGQTGSTPPSRQIVLDALPPQTGGVRVLVNTPATLGANLTRIAEVLAAQYAVTYTRPDGATPKLLQMAVAVAGAQMLVPRTPPR